MERASDFRGLRTVRSNFVFLDGLDMRLAHPKQKSIRLDGLSTCVRLERIYWSILKCMANGNSTTVNTLLTALDRDVQLRLGGTKNFSSLIRVICTAQLLHLNPDISMTSVLEHVE